VSVGVETRSIRQDFSTPFFYVIANDNIMEEQYSFHIGHLVKAVFDESGLTVAEFAKRIHCERTNVYKIFNRYTIDVALLVKISQALQHNFFVDVMNMSGLAADIPVRHSLVLSINDMSADNIDTLSRFFESLKNKQDNE
ncbi:MAG: helix-turn-helix transcriptional regulator, partial [Bacteroidales bacterium]|nr:helix-turn-helix transcriptional regulator [Bacteroidales bacterium]